MIKRCRSIGLSGIVLTFSLVMSASGGVPAGAATKATGTPIVFGAVVTTSGALALPEDTQAFNAYVANWNANGGYNGHPIKVIEVSDQGTPAGAADAARQLVNGDHAVAMLAIGINENDCPANNSFYQQSQIAFLGGSASCYIKNTDFVTAKLTNASGGLDPMMKFILDSGVKKAAIQGPSIIAPAFMAAQSFMKSIGGTLVIPPYTQIAPSAAEVDAYIAEARSAGARAVVVNAPVSSIELILQQASTQGFGPANGIKYIIGAGVKLDPTLSVLQGVYITSSGFPWSSNNAATKAAFRILKKYKVSTFDTLTTSGYQEGSTLQQIVDSVKGPVTRASFRKAAQHDIVSVALTQGLQANLANPDSDHEGEFFLQDIHGKFVQVAYVQTKE